MVQHADIDHTGIPGVPAGAGASVTDKLTADEAGATTATLQNTGLSFAVTNGSYYMFRFRVLMRTTSTTVGLKFGLTVPAFTSFGAVARIPILVGSNGTSGGEVQGAITASGEFLVTASAPTANLDFLCMVDGVLLPSADGTLMLQYAAETTGQTVTMRQGSAAELITL
jgi:hypothetical protein